MKRVVLGTAGHIDHGKTSLIKALTGVDTDRLKEEKERGITIELGFTFLTLPSGLKISIVDVPGHEKFVRHMVAGATGIDLVALIIAADEGVMPQTREHLDICKLLRVKKGLIALTKTDLVEKDWLDLVKEEIGDFVKGTFLEGGGHRPGLVRDPGRDPRPGRGNRPPGRRGGRAAPRRSFPAAHRPGLHHEGFRDGHHRHDHRRESFGGRRS